MEILWFDELSSTQTYLKEKLKEGKLSSPIAIVASRQTQGIGSRGNSWIGLEGNLFFSFAIARDTLPMDLALESSSIYFSYILKECLEEAGSKLWLKWPNDFYMSEMKIGGTITFLRENDLICGIGLNIVESPEGFNFLDININKQEILNKFFKKIENKTSWKQIFSKYKIEFERSKSYHTHYENSRISLENAVLNTDGSLEVNGERIYSLR
ncbi:MAG TPA: biotin--[acetyl-CoA-carboxylase] ligase [Sulfurimonas sp.]|nr:biotin--[acetyl-CoA-carboxylase] ligase [Sulfurimonas sp.]